MRISPVLFTQWSHNNNIPGNAVSNPCNLSLVFSSANWRNAPYFQYGALIKRTLLPTINHVAVRSATSDGYLDEISYVGRMLTITNRHGYYGYSYSSCITLLGWRLQQPHRIRIGVVNIDISISEINKVDISIYRLYTINTKYGLVGLFQRVLGVLSFFFAKLS